MQVARLARGGDAAPSFHPKAPLIFYWTNIEVLKKRRSGMLGYYPYQTSENFWKNIDAVQ